DPEHLAYSVRDAIDEDDPLLIDLLCQRVLPSRGIHVTADNILITAGSQQGLDLLVQLLVAPDTHVGVDDPGYVDAKHAFPRDGGQLVPLPVDAQGMLPPDDRLDIVYVTPSHHSPTNVTLDPSRRLRLLTHMREADSLIIEDDYDSEFRYRGKPTPALKALPHSQHVIYRGSFRKCLATDRPVDPSRRLQLLPHWRESVSLIIEDDSDSAFRYRGKPAPALKALPHSEHVIYLGSFSKFLAPGLRLGYIVAEPELIERMRTHRRYSIRHVPGHTQRAMALLIDSGQFHRTISRRRNHLRRKWETLTAALEKHLPWTVPFPAGGVSVWIEAPAGVDGRALAEECLRRGVVI